MKQCYFLSQTRTHTFTHTQTHTQNGNTGLMLLQINELKAENYEAEKDARLKVTNLQKQHEEAISNLQVSNIVMILTVTVMWAFIVQTLQNKLKVIHASQIHNYAV